MAFSPSSCSMSQIRTVIGNASFEELPELIENLRSDPRKGVQTLLSVAQRRWEKEQRERDRVAAMYHRMRELGGPGTVIGVDEVGRGSIAGPLTVAAVALPFEPKVWGLNDSKLLAPARREELAAVIGSTALAIGIAHIQPHEIDACGMAASLRTAMYRAVLGTGIDPDCVLIDGLPVHAHPKEKTIAHGDSLVACIAAASIVAKVTRDAIMVEADRQYPGYGFAQSKGYGSPDAIAAIRSRGLSDYHRTSFCRNFLVDGGQEPLF